MSEYHFWYKTTVEAKNFNEAFRKSLKKEPTLETIEHKNEELSSANATAAIGFEIRDEYEDEM